MSFVDLTPGSSAIGILLMFGVFIAVLGIIVGTALAEVVKARVMLLGSLVYWMVTLLISPFVGLSSLGFWWAGSMILVLFADVTYMVKYLVKRGEFQLKLGEAPVP